MERLVSMRVKSLDWVNQPKRKLMSQSPDAHPGLHHYLQHPPPPPQLPPGSSQPPHMVQAGGHWAGPRKKEFLVKRFLECPPMAGSSPKSSSCWSLWVALGAQGAELGPGLQPPARAPDEALGSAVTASQTCLLTSLPSRALGSQENPGRGMRSQKRQEDRLEKGLGRGAPPPQIWRVGRRRRVGRK